MKAPKKSRVLKQIHSYRRISMDTDISNGNLEYRGKPLFTTNSKPITKQLAVFMTDEEIAECISQVCGGFENE